MIELLAPAGNLESLKAAVKSGANAVYLGLDEYNARGNIENFNRENLADAVRFAHLFGCKVYMTLNILIKDAEIEKVVENVRFALSCKVDAFIIQDVGVATLLKKIFEGIELHASTQMGICNLEGALWLKKIGFSRIVLARETPIEEIKRIKENVDIEIEYFVQGALCVGYSGNCYFSSLIEGASGNRGKCKQLCRLPFEMEYSGGRKKGYLLSAKDFCLLAMLEDLVEAGVTSLKIEGRARRAAYVANAVQVYRKALDENFKYDNNDIIKLKKFFNRGNYIKGYFANEKIIYPSVCSHIGVEVGKVTDFRRGKRFNEIFISSSHKITKGDSLAFFKEGKEPQSIAVYDVKEKGKNLYYVTTTAILDKDARVSLIVDKNLEDDVMGKERKVLVDATFIAKVGQKAKLILSASNQEVKVESQQECQESISQPLGKEECLGQLSKMGENFKLANFEFDAENVFIRKAELNQLRRKALEELEEKIIKSNEKEDIKENNINLIKKDEKSQKNNKKILIFDDLNKLKNNYSPYNYYVFSPSTYKKEEIISFCKENQNLLIYLDTPPVANKYDIKYLKEIVDDCENLGVVANNYYALSFKMPSQTIIGSELNVFNSLSIEFYKSQGYDKIILSKEPIAEFDIKNKSGLFMNENFNERLIYFKHCPIKEHIGGDCGNCKFQESITYKMAGKRFLLKRIKIRSCLFFLKMTSPLKHNSEGFGSVEEK